MLQQASAARCWRETGTARVLDVGIGGRRHRFQRFWAIDFGRKEAVGAIRPTVSSVRVSGDRFRAHIHNEQKVHFAGIVKQVDSSDSSAYINLLCNTATDGLFPCYRDAVIIHGIPIQEARMGSIFDLVFNLFNGNAFSSDVTFGSANSGSNIGGSLFGSTGTPPV